MKRTLFAALAVAASTAALVAPSGAAADTGTSSAWACDRPVDCVQHLLIWIATYDPCLTCGDQAATRP